MSVFVIIIIIIIIYLLKQNSTNKKCTQRAQTSGFRTLDSRIRSVIRIATKIVLLGP